MTKGLFLGLPLPLPRSALLRSLDVHSYCPKECDSHKTKKGSFEGLAGCSLLPPFQLPFDSDLCQIPAAVIACQSQLPGPLEGHFPHGLLETPEIGSEGLGVQRPGYFRTEIATCGAVRGQPASPAPHSRKRFIPSVVIGAGCSGT